MKKFLALSAYIFAFQSLSVGQNAPSSIADSLQSILNQSISSPFPYSGGIMTVYVPGQWSWTGAAGTAISGQTQGQPQTIALPNLQFRVGSITKNMVAACILQLEQNGLLNINDPINNYLRTSLINDTIQPSATITIRHLLNHTSGIANSADNSSCQLNVLNNPLGSHTMEEAVYCGASQGELFPAGFTWAYSNTNYTLLAMIIEEVSGQSYQEYLTQHIIQPLNLSQTMIPANSQIATPHMGCYWNLGGNTWTDLTVIHPTTYTGWADVVSTTSDLISYFSALKNGNIINTTELAIMNTIDPASFDYGMGTDFYSIDNSTYVGHYGEVANTSGLFFGDIQSSIAPNGYYISYNFNIQGVAMQSRIDLPVMQLLKNTSLVVPENQELVAIFPNPTKDILHISFESNEGYELEILDQLGNVMKKETSLSGNSKFEINLSDLQSGHYLVRISNPSTHSIQSFIKL